MRRLLILFSVVIVALVAVAGTALAHVTVNPKTAVSGGFATLTFQVPNEKDDATTTKVEVQFPVDPPIAQASIKPVPGWTAKVANAKLTTPITTDDGDTLTESVKSITWSANDGVGVKAGEFQQFLISVGLPEATSLTFPAIQTYSDGSTVNWVDAETPNGPEPDHPAPVLTLTPANATETSATPATTEDDSDSGKTIAIIGLVVAGIALVLGGAALVTRRKPSATA